MLKNWDGICPLCPKHFHSPKWVAIKYIFIFISPCIKAEISPLLENCYRSQETQETDENKLLFLGSYDSIKTSQPKCFLTKKLSSSTQKKLFGEYLDSILSRSGKGV